MSQTTIAQDGVQVGQEIGWTKPANLKNGRSDLYFSAGKFKLDG